MRSYYVRIGIISLVLALATAGLIWRAAVDSGIRVLASAPTGDAVSTGATIRLTFSTDVDRTSAEQQFALSPPTPGRFFWEDRTLVFVPGRPLAAATEYQVTVLAGVRDASGRVSSAEQGWSFRTRGPRLLALRNPTNGTGEIWSVQLDGSDPQLIFSSSQGINSIAVDRSGDYLIYVEPRGSERTALMLLDLTDGSSRPLVDTTEASVSGAQWSPNGEFIVFERRALVNGALGVPRLWLTQPDGTLLGPLFSGDGSDISYAAAWSPDGNSIAFLDGSSLEILIYSFFSDTREPLGDSSSQAVSWLPDGSGLVYSSAQQENGEPVLRLRRYDLRQAQYADLSDGVGSEMSPAVSPDGATIAFSRRSGISPAMQIWLAPAIGGPPQRLTRDGDHQDTQAVWSLDGAQLAFVRRTISGVAQSSAWIVDREGGEPRLLLENVTQLVWAA